MKKTVKKCLVVTLVSALSIIFTGCAKKVDKKERIALAKDVKDEYYDSYFAGTPVIADTNYLYEKNNLFFYEYKYNTETYENDVKIYSIYKSTPIVTYSTTSTVVNSFTSSIVDETYGYICVCTYDGEYKYTYYDVLGNKISNLDENPEIEYFPIYQNIGDYTSEYVYFEEVTDNDSKDQKIVTIKVDDKNHTIDIERSAITDDFKGYKVNVGDENIEDDNLVQYDDLYLKKSSSKVVVYDENKNYVRTINFSSANNVICDGKLFCQNSVELDVENKDYSYVSNNRKYRLDTYSVDLKSGDVKYYDCKYLFSDMSEFKGLKLDGENDVYTYNYFYGEFRTIEDKKIVDLYSQSGIFDGNLNISTDKQDEIGYYFYLDDTHYIFSTNAGDYMCDEKGNIIGFLGDDYELCMDTKSIIMQEIIYGRDYAGVVNYDLCYISDGLCFEWVYKLNGNYFLTTDLFDNDALYSITDGEFKKIRDISSFTPIDFGYSFASYLDDGDEITFYVNGAYYYSGSVLIDAKLTGTVCDIKVSVLNADGSFIEVLSASDVYNVLLRSSCMVFQLNNGTYKTLFFN